MEQLFYDNWGCELRISLMGPLDDEGIAGRYYVLRLYLGVYSPFVDFAIALKRVMQLEPSMPLST